jgi:hypothetical protein
MTKHRQECPMCFGKVDSSGRCTSCFAQVSGPGWEVHVEGTDADEVQRVAEKLSHDARGKSESARSPGANSVTNEAAQSTSSRPETSATQKGYEMVDNRTMTEPELKARLEELRHDYDLSRTALIKGGYITYAAFASALATIGMGLYAFLQKGEGFLNGSHFIAIFLILAASLIIYFSFVFGRQAKLRAEISRTKKLLEVSSGESVRR